MTETIATVSAERDIETVTQEIRFIKRQAESIVLQSAIAIGRRLQEAKAMVPHGEWGAYLKDKVEFSRSTANNFMKVAEEYGDEQITLFGMTSKSQAFGNLSYTKALRLLAIPTEEREEFIAENDIEGMSTRDLEKAIRERDEARAALSDASETAAAARAAAAAAENEAAELKKQLAVANENMQKAKEKEQRAAEKLKALRENPEIPQEVLEKMRTEAEAAAGEKKAAEIRAEIAKAKAETDSAKGEAEQARKEAAEIAAKLAAMAKQVRAASPEVTVFKTVFTRVQEEYNRLIAALADVRRVDAETGEKLKAAVSAMMKNWEEKLK